MSDSKPEYWWGSFDHVVTGPRTKEARRLQAGRKVKFENKYGRNCPQEQQRQHQEGAGALDQGKDATIDDEDSALVDLVEEDDAPQGEEHGDMAEFLQDAACELGDQQQQHLQQHGQQQQGLVADQQLPGTRPRKRRGRSWWWQHL